MRAGARGPKCTALELTRYCPIVYTTRMTTEAPPRNRATSSARSSRRTFAAGRHTTVDHPLSARAERLSAHRPRQVDLPQLRRRRRVRRAAAISASTTRTRRRKRSSTSRRSSTTSHWLGFDWGEHLYHASDYFEQLYDWAEDLIRDGKAYVDSSTADEMRAMRGTLTEPGTESPYRDRERRGEPRSLPPHASGRVPRRRARAAGEDRHGLAEHQHARSGALPHPPRGASPHRRRLARSIRCTTTRIRCRTRSSTSRTRSARWSTRITARCTTG